MQIRVNEDSVHIEGYVNAVERNSKPLNSRIGRFVERICKGAFTRSLERNSDVHVLLNHDWSRDLGSTTEGNLKLREDSIGLHATLDTTDAEVVKDARNGDLVGWSFGFVDIPEEVERSTDTETGYPLRKVKDLMLREVSLLNRKKNPAYEGTLVVVRDDDVATYFGDVMETEIETREETQPVQHENVDTKIDYSMYENLIAEMKGEKK